MSKVDFYDDLSDEPSGTIAIRGNVLMSKNKNKWHLCKQGDRKPIHACGNGSPTDPNPGDPYLDDDYYEVRFNKSADVVGVREALEKDRHCSFCKRIIKDEFDLERVVVAVPSDPEPDATRGLVERFVRKLP